MNKQPFPKPLLVLILVILVLQIIATLFYWYWRISWFDMLMHFIGGFWVGLVALWVLFLSGKFALRVRPTTVSLFAVGILGTLTIAVLWEVFEYGVRLLIPQWAPYSVSDTLSDLLFGFLGGIVASFVFIKKRYKEK